MENNNQDKPEIKRGRNGTPVPDPATGGRVKSARKTAAVRVNAIKNGRTIRHPETLKALGYTDGVRIAGPDVGTRLALYREHYPALYARNREESISGVYKFLEESLKEILRLKGAGKPIHRELQSLSRDVMQLHELRFGKLNINANVSLNPVDDVLLWQRATITVLKRHGVGGLLGEIQECVVSFGTKAG